MSVPMAEWKWHGMPGHFIGWEKCCFRLHTTVGGFRISTVGCYHSPGSDQLRDPIGGTSPNPKPEDMPLYETYVFRLRPDGQVADWGEIDGQRYATEEAAEAGHFAYCREYAEVPA